MTFYKATRPNGTDFYSGGIDYAEALTSGEIVTHPLKSVKRQDDAHYYLSVSTVPTDCTGMRWPCRLFEVEPLGKTWVPDATSLPNKVACKSLRVSRELDSWLALGPQGAQLRDLVGQAQVHGLAAAWDAAWAAAWDAAWAAAWDAARDAARDAAGDAARDAAGDAARAAARAAARDAARAAAWAAAWDAARAAAGAAAGAAARAAARAAAGLHSRDLIGTHPGWDQDAYDLLTGPWRKVVGRIHPDDEEMS